jgi:hypothetical protein
MSSYRGGHPNSQCEASYPDTYTSQMPAPERYFQARASGEYDKRYRYTLADLMSALSRTVYYIHQALLNCGDLTADVKKEIEDILTKLNVWENLEDVQVFLIEVIPVIWGLQLATSEQLATAGIMIRISPDDTLCINYYRGTQLFTSANIANFTEVEPHIRGTVLATAEI